MTDWTFLNVIPILVGKAIKYGGKMVVEAVEKGGKALLDGAKKVSSKLQEGVSFLASKAKGLSNKIGDLWNKGKTKVKNDFIEAGKEFRYGMKKMGEYVPKFGRGPSLATEAAGVVSGGGKQSLKDDAYQYVKETGEKVFGSCEKDVVKGASGAKPVSNMKEFFSDEFGKSIKNNVTKTKNQFQGQSVYEVTK